MLETSSDNSDHYHRNHHAAYGNNHNGGGGPGEGPPHASVRQIINEPSEMLTLNHDFLLLSRPIGRNDIRL